MYKYRTSTSVSLIENTFLRNIFDKPLHVCAYIVFSLQTVPCTISGREDLFTSDSIAGLLALKFI